MKADVKSGGGPMRRERKSLSTALRRLVRPVVPAGLSARLLVLTIAVVLLSEVFIYVPSIANYREQILFQHLDAAQIAALAIEAADNNRIGADLSDELLANAGVVSVVLKRSEQRSLFLRPGQAPPHFVESFDLEHQSEMKSIIDAFKLMMRSEDRVILVRGTPRLKGGLSIEAVMHEAPVRDAMLAYSTTILESSLLISLLSAASVFGAIHVLLVRPMMRIERSMRRFRSDPDDPEAIIDPSDRRDEVGSAERELAAMQADLKLALNQRARLADLGAAVSKINHDLRNMLSSAQLFVDRLEKSEDPLVQRLAPKLVGAIGRAVSLCTNTLRYGRAQEAPPEPRPFELRTLGEDIGANVFHSSETLAQWQNKVPPGLMLVADPEQLFRVFLNLVRNAAQAIEVSGRRGEVSLNAYVAGEDVVIEVADTGPGVPEAARERLFAPFTSVQRPGGTGLGLTIASELVAAHGGRIELAETGPKGSVFRVTLTRARCK